MIAAKLQKLNKMYYDVKKMREDVQTRIAKNIHSLMEESGFKNISDFSRAINIPRQTISYWLLLKRKPQIEALELLADFFEITIDELFGRDFTEIS